MHALLNLYACRCVAHVVATRVTASLQTFILTTPPVVTCPVYPKHMHQRGQSHPLNPRMILQPHLTTTAVWGFINEQRANQCIQSFLSNCPQLADAIRLPIHAHSLYVLEAHLGKRNVHRSCVFYLHKSIAFLAHSSCQLISLTLSIFSGPTTPKKRKRTKGTVYKNSLAHGF